MTQQEVVSVLAHAAMLNLKEYCTVAETAYLFDYAVLINFPLHQGGGEHDDVIAELNNLRELLDSPR